MSTFLFLFMLILILYCVIYFIFKKLKLGTSKVEILVDFPRLRMIANFILLRIEYGRLNRNYNKLFIIQKKDNIKQ